LQGHAALRGDAAGVDLPRGVKSRGSLRSAPRSAAPFDAAIGTARLAAPDRCAL